MFLVWLILPWKLTVEEIGQFALLSFVIELLTRLTTMGMDSALLRFYVDESRRHRILASVGGWLAVGSGLTTIVLVLTYNVVPAVFAALSSIYHHLVWLVLLVAIVSALANIVLIHYVARNEAGRFGRLNTLRSLLLAGAYLLTAWSGLGLRGLLLGQLAAALVVVLLFWLSYPSRAQPFRPERTVMRELFTYGSPMLFYGLFSLVNDYAGRLALESHVALGALGVFQFYYQIVTQVNGVWASINRAWTPHMFKYLEANHCVAYARITRFSLLGTLICAAGIIAVMLFGVLGLWSVIVPPMYLLRIDLFYLLLLGPLFCCIYTAIYPAFYFQKNTLKISIIQSMISLLTIFLTFFFTVQFKSDGAALSWVLGIFITPLIYVSFFPRLRPRLGNSTTILLFWGGAGGLMVFSLLRLHSVTWAVAALLLGAVGTTIFGRNAITMKPMPVT